MAKSGARSGGQVLVDQLVLHGADMAFCVPGESYLEVLDALYDVRDRIKLVNARQEAGAANMADAYGKLTGRPGICLVTRGPGACQAAVGVHTAFQDSTPMILLIGQVARDTTDRESFQEVDYRQMFGPLAKWAAQIDQAERVPEYMARAFHVATSGRPGPVVLSLPEDMLTDMVEVRDAEPYVAIQPSPDAADMDRVRQMLEKAERPMLLVGGSRWTDAACAQMVAFAETWNIPTACSFRRMDLFDGRSRVYAGDFGTSTTPALLKRAKEVDLWLVVGARLGDITTQAYTTLAPPTPKPALIHVYPDANELGRVYRPTLGIASGPVAFANALTALRPAGTPRWGKWTEGARADYVASLDPQPYNGELDMGRAMAQLRETLPASAIVTLDAGNHTGWPMRYLTYGRPGRLVGPTSGAMAYSVPAAVAASLVHRDRLVIGCVGDGGFMMSGQEFATAVQHGGKPIILVFNNKIYGTIRMHQEREHPERISGTDLINPDFAALARAYGGHGETVTRTDDFMPAFQRAVASGKAAIIELKTDPELVTTRTTITAIRDAAKKRMAEKAPA
jgi:acetolactate synthase I/II/III large subunit